MPYNFPLHLRKRPQNTSFPKILCYFDSATYLYAMRNKNLNNWWWLNRSLRAS